LGQKKQKHQKISQPERQLRGERGKKGVFINGGTQVEPPQKNRRIKPSERTKTGAGAVVASLSFKKTFFVCLVANGTFTAKQTGLQPGPKTQPWDTMPDNPKGRSEVKA